MQGFSMLQQSKDSVRFLVGLKKENTKRFYIKVFEGEKDKYYQNKTVDYCFANIFDKNLPSFSNSFQVFWY